jgi:hypothetical protein
MQVHRRYDVDGVPERELLRLSEKRARVASRI